MGRYVAEYTIGQPDDFIRLVSEDYFQKEGFKLVPYKGEMLWKKGILSTRTISSIMEVLI